MLWHVFTDAVIILYWALPCRLGALTFNAQAACLVSLNSSWQHFQHGYDIWSQTLWHDIQKHRSIISFPWALPCRLHSASPGISICRFSARYTQTIHYKSSEWLCHPIIMFWENCVMQNPLFSSPLVQLCASFQCSSCVLSISEQQSSPATAWLWHLTSNPWLWRLKTHQQACRGKKRDFWLSMLHSWALSYRLCSASIGALVTLWSFIIKNMLSLFLSTVTAMIVSMPVIHQQCQSFLPMSSTPVMLVMQAVFIYVEAIL